MRFTVIWLGWVSLFAFTAPQAEVKATLDTKISEKFQSLTEKLHQSHQTHNKRKQPSAAKKNITQVQPKKNKPATEKPKTLLAVTTPLPRQKLERKPMGIKHLRALANKAALRYGLSPALFRALIHYESRWKIKARSKFDAVGLTQITLPVAKICGLTDTERYQVAKNLNCGAWYLAQQKKRFGSYELALAAYNSGPTRVAHLKRIPNIFETQRYVKRVMLSWQCESNHNKPVCD